MQIVLTYTSNQIYNVIILTVQIVVVVIHTIKLSWTTPDYNFSSGPCC